jgi:hypothetical protein
LWAANEELVALLVWVGKNHKTPFSLKCNGLLKERFGRPKNYRLEIRPLGTQKSLVLVAPLEKF